MHGLGDTGQGWEPVAKMLAPHFPGTKWILPHAVSPFLQLTLSKSDIDYFNAMTEDHPGFDQHADENVILV